MKTNFKAMMLGMAGLGVIGISLLHLLAGQTALRLVAVNATNGGSKTNLTFRLEMQSGSNQVIYVLQSSTNLVNWESVVSGRATAGSTIQVQNVSPTNKARYFRVHEFKPNLVDTNPPAWSNSISPTWTIGAGGDVTLGWNAAGDDIGVASYLLYVNGVLVTNQLASLLTYQFAVDLHRATDVRIAAMDASSNSTPILSLVYLPGDGLAAISDDCGRVFVMKYYSTNALQTNSGFGPAVQVFASNGGDRGLGMGDFDRDGVLDIIAGRDVSGYMQPYFLKGKGDGTFAPAVPLPNAYGANGWMMGATVGDFDGDGNLDFVVDGNERYVFFYWGNGDGTFTVTTADWGCCGRALAVGDFNEDGRMDLSRATYSDGRVRMFLSNGDRTFTETNEVGLHIGNNDPYAMTAGDFDEDGHMDLLVAGGSSGDVTYFKGLGDGTLTNLGVNGLWGNLRTGTYGGWDTFDYNGDGHLDLVMGAYNGQAYFWAGNGDGTFSSNRVTLITGICSSMGATTPPLPPRVDVNLAPLDPIIALNGTVVFNAYGSGVTTNDLFRWSHGDETTNLVAWTFGAGTNYGEITASHTYTNEGRLLTRLWHTATNGINSVRGTWVTVKGAPPVADPGGPYTYGSQVATSGVWYATVDGSASTDDFGIVTYIWDFGDGQKATNRTATAMHGYPSNGVYALKLTVVDSARQTDTKGTTVTLTNGAPPVAVITGPATVDETYAHSGTWTATYSASSSTGPVGIWQYFWRNLTTGQTGNGSSFQTSWYGVGTNYVSLTVTGNDGQTNSTVYTVWVKANALPVPVIQGPHLLGVDVATNGLWFGAWNATNSTDDTGIYTYSWNFGDGATANGSQVTHSYGAVGVYALRLSATDNGNQTITATQSVIVVAGNPPVARITASTLSPEGSQPVSLSAANSTSDRGIYLYTWFLPPRQYSFAGRYLDANQWASANAQQNDQVTIAGQTSWGSSYFFSIGTQLQRGCSIQGRVDTPSTANSHAMVGLKNLNIGSGQYGQYPYAIYFDDGNLQIYENGGYRGQPTNYAKGTSYDFRIETKPGAGARYFLRPTGSGQAFVQIFDSNNLNDGYFSFGADVYNGVFNFDQFSVDNIIASGRDITASVYPGGDVTLRVVDNALLTNTATVTISPVTGAGPIAQISGPTNGVTGLQLAFSGYGSSDDHAIATYAWDFGDSSGIVFGPAVNHSYATPGTYTNTLTVHDYADQWASASMVVTIGGSNALVHVPWLIINGLEEPHEIYFGKTNTLKAVARGIPVPFTNIWTFGDGSGSVTNVVSTYSATVYNLEARHAYTGGEGTPYYASVSVILTNGTIYQDSYPLLMKPKTLDTEMKVAIDEGLWWLHKVQNRYDFDAVNKGGDWNANGARISPTASAVQAFAVNGHLMTDDASRDPYVETVQRGVNYLLSAMYTVNIGMQTYGDPDGNHNGIGLSGIGGSQIYETGPLMDALVAVARPELVAPMGVANVKGRLFKDIVQDLVDTFCWGQSDYDNSRGGGWRYSWNSDADNSASQWGAIGMLAAERFWGITIPSWVKERNKLWVAHTMDSTGFGYTDPGSGAGYGPLGENACTPSALVQLAFDDLTTTNAMWIRGEAYLANYWSTLMGLNDLYGNYSIAKALRTANPQPVHNFALTGKDWFLDPVNGLARVTIDHQNLDGSWNSTYRVDPQLASPWSVLILTSSLFQQGPVAVISVSPNPSAMGFPVVFDGRNSYHKHPGYKILEYRWIFDSSKGLDFDHPDAIGAVVTNVYGALSTNTVALQVRDNSSPALLDVASVVVQTTVPPYPPSADAGGPYVACSGANVHLDGSGSFCVDAASGNFIQSYDWEVYYQVPVTFNQGVSGVHAIITNGYPVAGTYTIGLRVKNANSLVYTNFALPDQTADAFTTVYVYDRVITDLKVRPKATKAQLTWTKAGDYGVIMRSTEGPDRGFTQVGQTDSSYATYLDTTIDYNTDYYYRIYAYRKGQATPIGLSDAVFLHSAPRSFDEHAPHFQSTPLRIAKVGQLYEVTLDAVDPENKPLYFSMLQGPTNLVVNHNTGLVDYTPTAEQIGNQFLSFQVTNAVGRDVLSYTLFVFPATNQVPVVNVNGPYAALTGQEIQFSSAGTSDADGNTLRYFWNFGDGSTSTNANPVHVYGGIGDYLVSLFVNDGYGGTASAQTHAEITRPNRAPVALIANGPSFTVRLGETLTLNGSGSYDLDGDPTTYRWTWGDGAVNANAATTLAHLYAATGAYTGSLVVADNRGGAGTNVFHVTVGAANRPPVVAFTVSTNNPYVMSTVTLDASATVDPDGDPMTYNWDFGDRVKTTGPLVTHEFKQIQDFLVTLTVADNHGAVTVATQTVHVVNAPPVFTSQPLLLTRAGTNYTYTPTVSDADEDAHSFQLVTGPATMSCDTNTGTLSWFPGTNNVGTNPIVLRVTDVNGGSADQAYTLVVTTPLGPQIDLQPTHMELTNMVVDGQSLALSGTVRVYLKNNGSDNVPVPFTVSLFVDGNGDGAYSTNADLTVGYGVIAAGFPAGGSGYVEMSVAGQALMKDGPVYAFVDSQNVVPEYNKFNNIMRSGSDLPTNVVPVVDLSAAKLDVGRQSLPTNAVLTARLGNVGLVSVPTNVPMAFYDGDPKSGGQLIGVARTTNALAVGRYADVSVSWANPVIAAHTVYVVADDPGTGTNVYPEINLSNNVLSVAVDLSAILPPVADAGQGGDVILGDTVVLNGSGSSDPQGRPLTYRWSMLSIPITSRAQLTGADTVTPSFQADAAGPFTLQLVVNNGLLDSTNTSTIKITAVDTNVVYPPTITSTPSFQSMAGVLYSYQVIATDPQNQPLKYRLPQGPRGMTINTNSGLVQWTPTNTGSFLVQVAADGIGGSYYQGYTLTVISYTNLPPQFTSTPVTTSSPNTAYTYTAVASDVNNDSLTYALTQKPSGMTINAQSGVISWTPTTNQLGGNAVTVTASDGHGGTATQVYNLVVLTAGANGPVVQAIPDQTVADPNAFATISLDNYVADPQFPQNQITWTVTGANLLSVSINSNRVATISYAAGARTSEQLTFLATDPAGKAAYAAATFSVRGVDNPPVAAIANLSDSTATSVTTGFFELLGTADDADAIDAVAYRVRLFQANGVQVADVTPGPLNSAGWHEGRVAAGGSLGKLDLTTVLNGAYTMMLEVQGGTQIATATAYLALDSDLKIGQVQFAQQDLVLPVQGVGLQVARYYNSFNPNTSDFGYSWTYAISDLNVQFDEDRTIVQDAFGDDVSLRTGGSRDVTIDMPDTGRRVTFAYSLGQGGLAKLRASWTPPPGVNASLVPTVSPVMISLWGLTYWQAAPIETSIDNFDFPGFVLTTKDGTQYLIQREDLGTHFLISDGGAIGSYVEAYGKAYVSRITKPDGSHTDFVRNGTLLTNINQYDNSTNKLKSILFQRDGQGRITAIYTPENLDAGGTPVGPASVNYAYDTAGNLVRVQRLKDGTIPGNAQYLTNTYVYAHPRFTHLLTEVIDARGISVLRTEFDSAGRLIGTYDAAGNHTTISRNIDGRSETIFDKVGNPTTYVYDDHGKLTARTDALGNTTLYSHDATGNTTSVTDPLGNKTTISYDTSGNLTTYTDPLGNPMNFNYDSQGQVLSIVDGLGRVTTNSYDGNNRLTSLVNPLGQTVRYNYDAQGNPTSVLDVRGNASMQYVYDASGLPSQVTTHTGVKVNYTYDARGFRSGSSLQWVNPDNTNDVRTLSAHTYCDDLGRPTNTVNAAGLSTFMQFNDFNQPVRLVDVRGNTATKTYDLRGNLIESVDPDGAISRVVYDANDRVVLKVERMMPNQPGYGVLTTYDAVGQPVLSQVLSNVVIAIDVTTNNGVVIASSRFVSAGAVVVSNQTIYDAAGRAVAKVDTYGQTNRYEYDAAGHNTAVIDPLGNRFEYKYDAAGHTTVARDPAGREINFLYDKGGRITRTIYTDGNSSQTVYDDLGNRQSRIDEMGLVRDIDYDTAGHVGAVTLPAVPDPEASNALTRPHYSYETDAYGNLRTIRDAKGRETHMAYDQFNRVISRTLPGGQTEYQAYDAFGQNTRATNFNGQVTEFVYDSLGRISQKKIYAAGSNTPGKTVTISYDAAGHQSQAVDERGATHYSYDLNNRITAIATPEGIVNYDYDAAGRHTRTFTANSETLYGYDQLGRLETVTVVKRDGQVLSQPAVTAYAYDALGNRQTVTLPNGVQTKYEYDLRSRLTRLTQWDASSNLLASYNYSLNARGQRTAATEIKRTVGSAALVTNTFAYGYDALGRLTAETNLFLGTNRSGYISVYTYDLVGNRLSRKITVGNKTLTTSYAYDQNDRLLLESNSVAAASSPFPGVAGPNTPSPWSRHPSLEYAANHVFAVGACYYALKAVPYFLLTAFVVPMAALLRRRRVQVLTPDLCPGRALFPRCLSGFLAGLMVVISFDQRVLADEATLYAALSTDTWAVDGSVIAYQYDAAGAVVSKTTTGSKAETVNYVYNLDNRLATATTVSTNGGVATVETAAYVYDLGGNRIRSEAHTLVNGVQTSGSTNYYLMDIANPTALPQILEESPAIGAAPTRSYTIGDDVLAQTSTSGGTGNTQYLLYDGHGSTRELVSESGVVTDSYAYDAYGVMAGDRLSASAAKTQLLYAGEYYDGSLRQYNLRARNYDPSNGRFTSVDPLMGSMTDPQSLHKYLYAGGDPVNGIDPTGMQTLGDVMCAVAVIGTLVTLGGMFYNGLSGNGWLPDAAMYGASLTLGVPGSFGIFGGLTAGAAAGPALLFSLLGSTAAAEPAKELADQMTWTLGAVGASYLISTIADMIYLSMRSVAAGPGSLAQLTYTVGLEIVGTATDGTLALWGYHGPGVNIGTTSQGMTVSATFYGGVVWGVPTWDSYAGPFLVASLTADVWPEVGITAGWFTSATNPKQNGVLSGVTFGSSPGAGGAAGLTYYSPIAHAKTALNGFMDLRGFLILAWPPGYGILLLLKSLRHD